ncbi:MAG TPA: EamA family transporter RarD [Drouetiella sp.]|jgi:chloramphenicol-sensitive protein RarD
MALEPQQSAAQSGDITITEISAPSLATSKALEGAFYAVLAYGFWGFVPVYWKLIANVPAPQTVAHRVGWSVIALAPLLIATGKMPELFTTLKSGKKLALLFVTATLLSLNWLAFIWAVTNNAVLDSSLGYFMNPLVNVAFGRIFLKEHLRPAQFVAVLLALSGVVALTVQAGRVPALSIFLAVTFSAYGLLRKMAPVEPLVGLSVETLLMLPFAGAYLFWTEMTGSLQFFKNFTQDLLVALAGPVTTLPLLWFAAAGKRLKYSTLGFFQYISPTCQFLLAVFVYHEVFTRGHLYAFVCIWIALGIYLIDSLMEAKNSQVR